MAGLYKASTGICGLRVIKEPHRLLLALFEKTERELSKMPGDFGYRKKTQAIIDHRISAVNEEHDISRLEQRINCGQIEEVIEQAEQELKCARGMNMYKPWGTPVLEEPSNQWKWPI